MYNFYVNVCDVFVCVQIIMKANNMKQQLYIWVGESQSAQLSSHVILNFLEMFFCVQKAYDVNKCLLLPFAATLNMCWDPKWRSGHESDWLPGKGLFLLKLLKNKLFCVQEICLMWQQTNRSSRDAKCWLSRLGFCNDLITGHQSIWTTIMNSQHYN